MTNVLKLHFKHRSMFSLHFILNNFTPSQADTNLCDKNIRRAKSSKSNPHRY